MDGDCRKDGCTGNRDQYDLREDLGQKAVEDELSHYARQNQQQCAASHHLEGGKQRFLYLSQNLPSSAESVSPAGAIVFASRFHTVRDTGTMLSDEEGFRSELDFSGTANQGCGVPLSRSGRMQTGPRHAGKPARNGQLSSRAPEGAHCR
jgi:hypothetical protein